jgi:alkyl sulfatase BDS1-like metallo-beta-lactamase superfamily hydrolase
MKTSFVVRHTFGTYALVGSIALLSNACSKEQHPARSAEAEVGAQRGEAGAQPASDAKRPATTSSTDTKPASTQTQAANAAMMQRLDFSDRDAFEQASRGLMAKPTDTLVKDSRGTVIWDMAQFDFVKGAPPPTVNPSLWRQAQLNNNYGLFKVVEGIYQLRGFDLSNMTLIKGNTGYIVIDPLTTKETAAKAWAFAMEHLPKLPVKAIIYTHSHADHFGGVKGVIDEADVKSGKIKVYAPEGFLEEAVSENVYAGPAMLRRGTYMFGPLLPRDAKGHVDSGLGKSATNGGTMTLIAPTDIIKKTGEKRVIDGVPVEFLMAPRSEAPAEMLFFFPKYKALCASEDAVHTLHNLYTLRGAQVRDARLWSSYLHQAVKMFGDRSEVAFASHHWPTWGKKEVVSFLEKQRDMYKYLHDQTLRLANDGYTMNEIAELMDQPGAIPNSIAGEFFNRGYYGTVNHNVKGTYQRYLGWFDANPATLHALPPEEASKKYVQFMGGEANVLEMAKRAYDAGDYRWVAEVVNHVVFANPKNQVALRLQADALEQLGYQTESGTWRGFYLTGAQELRKGVSKQDTTVNAEDMVTAMTLPMILDNMAIQIDGPKAAQKDIRLNLAFSDTGERYYLTLTNGVLNYSEKEQGDDATATYTMTRKDLGAILTGKTKLEDATKQGDIKVKGDAKALGQLMSLMSPPKNPMFNIVTP